MKQKWISVLLKRSGKTGASLAQHLGIEPPRISEMINAHPRPRAIHIGEVPRLAEFFGYSIEDVVRLANGASLESVDAQRAEASDRAALNAKLVELLEALPSKEKEEQVSYLKTRSRVLSAKDLDAAI